VDQGFGGIFLEEKAWPGIAPFLTLRGKYLRVRNGSGPRDYAGLAKSFTTAAGQDVSSFKAHKEDGLVKSRTM
jgi:hypothetical protein